MRKFLYFNGSKLDSMLRKVIFELVLLGIALGLTVEVIKSAIPYLPVIWLLVAAHYTWEIATSEPVITYSSARRKGLIGRGIVSSYIVIGIVGAAVFCGYWWGLTTFFAPKIAAYEAERKKNEGEIGKQDREKAEKRDIIRSHPDRAMTIGKERKRNVRQIWLSLNRIRLGSLVN